MKQLMLLSQGIIFFPIIVAILVYIFSNEKFNHIVFVVQSFVTAILVRLWWILLDDGIQSFTLGNWSRQIGIEIKIDEISLIFMTMAVLIWWVVLIYAWHQKKSDHKFIFFLMFLEGCFNAYVQVFDLFTFFILIEIITIISSILILYKKDGISLKAGLYYLLFNSIGMTIYLFGLILIYLKLGTLNMSILKDVITSQQLMASDFSVINISFTCFFVAMCVKAAMFPVYDWLPRAHTAAPSHISALLSALLVKTGLFGLIRIMAMYQFVNVYELMFYLGFFTAISGSLFAIAQNDLKGILAFSTISQIGLIMMSLSTGTDTGTASGMLHLFSHFLFKSLLFLGAGIIINEYGVRRVSEINGIFRTHPLLSISMLIGIFSITGTPLFIGYLSKIMIQLSLVNPFKVTLFKIASIGTIVYFLKFSRIFFGPKKESKVINKGKQFSVLWMAICCIVFFVIAIDVLPIVMSITKPLSSTFMANLETLSHSIFKIKYWLEYLIIVGIGLVIYKFIVLPFKKPWHLIRQFRIKFQDAIVSLLIFLVLVMNII